MGRKLIESIKARRKLLNLSQVDLAEYSGVGIATIKDFERGVGNPTVETLEMILKPLGMELYARKSRYAPRYHIRKGAQYIDEEPSVDDDK